MMEKFKKSKIPAEIAMIFALFLSLFLKIQFVNHAYMIPELMCLIAFYNCISFDVKLPYKYIFIYSIFGDIFQDLPLGTMMLSYFVFIELLNTNRRYIHDRGPAAYLISFGLSYCCFLLVKIIICVATYGFAQISLMSYFLELISMLCYFPYFHELFNFALRKRQNER